MAAITRIDVKIRTGNREGAGTNAEVYLGICGRELLLDTTGPDFEKGQDDIFKLGRGSNSFAPERSDPRRPRPLDTEDLDSFPMWIRFKPAGSNDNWNVEAVRVTVNPGPDQERYEALRKGHLWLGRSHGQTWFVLTKEK
jgi:hypothetical protein